MDSLQSVIPRVLKKRGLFQHAQASHVTFSAQQWIDLRLPGFAGDLRVEEFSDATLKISCKHSIAAQECHPLTEELLAYLLQEFPMARIEDVRLVRAKK